MMRWEPRPGMSHKALLCLRVDGRLAGWTATERSIIPSSHAMMSSFTKWTDSDSRKNGSAQTEVVESDPVGRRLQLCQPFQQTVIRFNAFQELARTHDRLHMDGPQYCVPSSYLRACPGCVRTQGVGRHRG